MKKEQTSKFSIKIASDTERENIFAEIYYNEEEWAEISQEGEKPLIAFFPPLQGKYWEFPLQNLPLASQRSFPKVSMNQEMESCFFWVT